MPSNNEKIIFTTEDNEEIEFYVLEQTMINGINYLLIADSAEDDDEEANALILKEKDTVDKEIIYDVVENDEELEAVSKVFETMMDDIDIEMNKA
ncbi:MAG: DUF1292 domain-containing protein [bacterium]|nr:DUF1292 domain-containing protein [bacterium]